MRKSLWTCVLLHRREKRKKIFGVEIERDEEISLALHIASWSVVRDSSYVVAEFCLHICGVPQRNEVRSFLKSATTPDGGALMSVFA